MYISNGAALGFRAIIISLTLTIGACSGAGSQQPPDANAVAAEPATGMAKCDAALTDTSTNPPRRLAAPSTKWVTTPNMRVVVNALMAAAPDRSHPIPESCGVVRVFVAADGTVHDVTILAEYPSGIGFGDALVKYMAPVAYPPSAAGGPYGIDIAIRANRRLMRRSAGL